MERLVEVTLEIDAELKEQAEKVFAENGMTMIRTLGCSWKGTAYMLGRDLPPCFPMAGTRLPLK